MSSTIRKFCSALLSLLLTAGFLSAPAQAQENTVTRTELREALRKAAAEKDRNLQQIRSFFAEPQARAALSSAGVDYEQVQKTIAALDADDLAKIASQTSRIQADFAAGALTNQELTYIIIALAAAVLVLIVVAA